jgi:hypothetical protein
LRGGFTSRCGGHIQQLSRKGWLDRKEQSSQVFEKTQSLISIFPEETCSWESMLLLVLSYRGALTVGFRFGAAANPILTQLNRGEGRHSVARAVFHGQRGELRQRYREGQEDQLGALGLVGRVPLACG